MSFRQLAYLPDRRSTRTEQSVHITVHGLDASRAPYQEKASTLTVNCHGCRYLSRNNVLRGDTATLEVVPHRADLPKITTQVRVVSVKPIGDEMLFDIAVELESPQNIWGIAPSPEDWSQFSTLEEPLSPPRENRVLPWPQTAKAETAKPEAAKVEASETPDATRPQAKPSQVSPSPEASTTPQLPPLVVHLIDSLREPLAPTAEAARAAAKVERNAEDQSRLMREYCAHIEIEVTKVLESLLKAVSEDLARGANPLSDTPVPEVPVHDTYEPWVRKFEQQLANANRRRA